MNNFLKEAIKLKELQQERQANIAYRFFFLKVFSVEEEINKLKEIETQTENANVIIVRCKKYD